MQKNEFEMLQGILECTLHIRCTQLERTADALYQYVGELYERIQAPSMLQDAALMRQFSSMIPQVIYGTSGRFGLYHLAFLEPHTPHNLFLLGPCLLAPANDAFILHILKQNGIEKSALRQFKLFYQKWPVVDRAQLHTVGRTIAHYLYGDVPFDHRYLHAWQYELTPPAYVEDASRTLEMSLLEQCSGYENQLLNAIKAGRRNVAFDIFPKLFSGMQQRPYCDDPLRNAKDHCIAFHALLYKMAERAGIHPLFVEDVAFPIRGQIEKVDSMFSLQNLEESILRQYIQLIQRMSTATENSLVQRTINHIHMNLSTPLSVGTLANVLQVTPDYLSRIFKKEMGLTLTEYVHRVRISRAIQYLDESDFSVRDIALYVGFEDINYFSRIFKRYVGQTPREYRRIVQGKDPMKAIERAHTFWALAGSQLERQT